MKKKQGWDYLLDGDYEAALPLLKKEHFQRPCRGTLANLGTVYLCMGEPTEAKKWFDEAENTQSDDHGTLSGAGVARWLLGEREEAVRTWLRGIENEFQDAAGGMSWALLTFYAAARAPEIVSPDRARGIVEAASRHPWAECWPGPLGNFVLGRIKEASVRKQAEFDNQDVMRRQLNQVEFYAGIIAATHEQADEFRSRLRRCALAGRCQLNDEWHLARYEVANLDG